MTGCVVLRGREMAGDACKARDRSGREEVTYILLSKDCLKINILSHMTSDQSVKTMHEKHEITCTIKTKQYNVTKPPWGMGQMTVV